MCTQLFNNKIFSICFFLFSIIIIGGCGFSGRENKVPEIPEESWFVLNKGDIIRVTDIFNRESDSLLPWTIQERITDIALCNKKLYFSVNGYGIFTIQSMENNRVVFKKYYDPGYFEYKTLTTILPINKSGNKNSGTALAGSLARSNEEEILCHLYFNSMLFPFQIEDFLYDSANIVTLTPAKDGLFIEEMYPVLPEAVPHWEIVGFLPLSRDKFYCEWKNSQKTYSEFRYSSYMLDGQKEDEINWEDFLDAYRFIPIKNKNTPGPLKLLCEKLMAESNREISYTTYHFLVEEKSTHITSHYISEASVPLTHKEFEIITIRMFEDEKRYYALIQPGSIYFINKNARIKQITLPSLPEGFHFTDFFVHENKIYVTWEESVFVNVGAAGLFILKDDILL